MGTALAEKSIEIALAGIICLTSYFLGCISAARLLAKGFKNLNIYKVGTGMADAENIYLHISEPLGVLCGLLDFAKMAGYLLLLRFLANTMDCHILARPTMIFVFGFFGIAGHCLPITRNFKGGRGIFTYIGLLAVFLPWEMLVICILAGLFVKIFKQHRFAQYFIVLTPPLACFIMGKEHRFSLLITVAAVLMGIFNLVVSKKHGEL